MISKKASALAAVSLVLLLTLVCSFFGAIERNRRSKLRVVPASQADVPHESKLRVTDPVARAGVKPEKGGKTAPRWAIPYGKEFWKVARESELAQPAITNRAANLPKGIDLSEVTTRVSHAIRDCDSVGNPWIQARSYSAIFEERGLTFRPRKPLGPEEEISGPEALFRTREIRSGEGRIDAGAPAEWLVIGNTAQRAIGADLVEHYESLREGVEATWILKKKPQVLGDLEVVMAVEGLTYGGLTEKGFHFADATGGARVRVGNAILVDASGKRVALETICEGDSLKIRARAEIMASAEFPIAIDPFISAEFGMDQPVIGIAAHLQDSPRVASNGQDFLVVWHDYRSGASLDVIGTRVTTNGVILDREGLLLASGAQDQGYPVVASNGRDYLVAWVEAPPSPFSPLFSFPGTGELHGTRVSGAGAILDVPGLLISSSPRSTAPAVASDGANYLVSWIGDSVDYNVHSAAVLTNGLVGDDYFLASNFRSTACSVASNGRLYYVVWSRNATEVQGLKVDLRGAPIGSPLTLSQTNSYAPYVTCDGTNFFVVWQTAYPAYNIYGARVSGTGALLDVDPISIAAGGISPVAASIRGDYLVAWRSGSYIRGRRVSGTGEVDLTPIILGTDVPDYSNSPSIAANESEYLVVWDGPGDRKVRGTFVSTDGSIAGSGGFPIGLGRNNEESPKVASNGDNFLVVWEDFRDPTGSSDIYGVRLNRAGDILDPNGLAISRALDRQWKPAVASNGTDYMAVWSDDRPGLTHIFATPITGAGVVLAPDGIQIDPSGNAQFNSTVASDGSGYLVAWEDGPALFEGGPFPGPAPF